MMSYIVFLSLFSGGAVERLEYVKELMKYIKVDSYGHCLNNMKHSAGRYRTAAVNPLLLRFLLVTYCLPFSSPTYVVLQEETRLE